MVSRITLEDLELIITMRLRDKKLAT